MARTVTATARRIVYGEDARVRATWRVLLAWPVLWILTGAVLTANAQASLGFLPAGEDQYAGLTQSVLHAGFLVILLVPWARFLERRPLSAFGIAATPAWLRDLVLGFLAVVLGFVGWLAIGSVTGSISVSLALANPEGSLALGLVTVTVALLLHAAVQQVVFFRVILGDATEGLRDRDLSLPLVIVGALAVTIVLFIAMHGSTVPLRLLDLAVAATVFGLLYLCTSELALGTGAHFGALASGVVFYGAESAPDGPIIFRVTGDFPGVFDTLAQYGLPKMVLAGLVLLGWLRWRRDSSFTRGIPE